MPVSVIRVKTEAPRVAKLTWDVPAGWVNLGVVTEDDSEPGLYLDMTRAAINDLIRDLRLARDAVFGADE
jgi:hypothetical protein